MEHRISHNLFLKHIKIVSSARNGRYWLVKVNFQVQIKAGGIKLCLSSRNGSVNNEHLDRIVPMALLKGIFHYVKDCGPVHAQQPTIYS